MNNTGLIILGITLIALAIIAVVMRVKLSSEDGETQKSNENNAGGTSTGTRPVNNKPPKKGFGWATVIIVAVVAGLLTWGAIALWGGGSARSIQVENPGIPAVQPREEWVFSQIEENERKRTFEVEITKRETRLLWFVVQQKCGGEKRNMGGFKLDSNGDDWTGTWVNYLDQDYGEAELHKVSDNIWSGHYKLQNGSRVDCTLKLTRK